MRFFLLLLALASAPALAQVTVNAPNTVNPAGQPIAVEKVHIVNPDGSIGSAGAMRYAALTDGSGTVTTGGTSQQVFAASTTRGYLFCQNPIAATEPLFINIGSSASTAGGSYELAAGGSLSFSGAVVPSGAVNVTATTAAHRFVCKQA